MTLQGTVYFNFFIIAESEAYRLELGSKHFGGPLVRIRGRIPLNLIKLGSDLEYSKEEVDSEV